MTEPGFKTKLRVEEVDALHWRVFDPLVYRGSKGDTIIVPAGEVTDFASVPNWTQSLFPRTGVWTKAAVVHDYLCTLLNDYYRYPKGYPDPEINSVDADGIFRLIMEQAGVRLVRRWLMWTGVRWGALLNPARRAGWLSTAPAVLGISLAVLAPVLGLLGWLVWL